ncbi:MAG: HEAT repeat domain-containing protein [Gemmataceae bacterium]
MVTSGSLLDINHHEELIVPVLLKLLESKDWEARTLTAFELRRVGEKYPNVFPSLIKALKDSDDRVIASVATSLGHLRRDPEISVPALIAALRERKHKKSRVAIVFALGQLLRLIGGTGPTQPAAPSTMPRKRTGSMCLALIRMIARERSPSPSPLRTRMIRRRISF